MVSLLTSFKWPLHICCTYWNHLLTSGLMQFDAFSLYQQNAQKLKIRESTTYGIHIDEESGVVVACSDFGHIHVYSHEINKTLECDNMNQNESQCTNSGSTLSNKTLHTAIPPIFSCKVGHFSSAKVLFCGGSNNTLKGYLWDTIMTSEHNSVIVPDFNLMGGSADNVGSVVSIACVSKVLALTACLRVVCRPHSVLFSQMCYYFLTAQPCLCGH